MESEFGKGIMYDERPKMKRDAQLKAVFFLSKKTAFSRASLFIFGRSSYVTLLIILLLTLQYKQFESSAMSLTLQLLVLYLRALKKDKCGCFRSIYRPVL